MNTNRIENLGFPVKSFDAINKTYLEMLSFNAQQITMGTLNPSRLPLPFTDERIGKQIDIQTEKRLKDKSSIKLV
jgi:hypothetical protein